MARERTRAEGLYAVSESDPFPASLAAAALRGYCLDGDAREGLTQVRRALVDIPVDFRVGYVAENPDEYLALSFLSEPDAQLQPRIAAVLQLADETADITVDAALEEPSVLDRFDILRSAVTRLDALALIDLVQGHALPEMTRAPLRRGSDALVSGFSAEGLAAARHVTEETEDPEFTGLWTAHWAPIVTRARAQGRVGQLALAVDTGAIEQVHAVLQDLAADGLEDWQAQPPVAAVALLRSALSRGLVLERSHLVGWDPALAELVLSAPRA